jgi:hypothetical protein
MKLLYFQGSLCGVVIGLGEFVAGVCYNRNSFSLQQFRVPIRIQKFVQVNVAPMLQMDVFPFNTHPTGNPQVVSFIIFVGNSHNNC